VNADHVLEVNPSTGAVRKIGEAMPGTMKYTNLALAKNGNIYAAPVNADHVLEVNPSTGAVRKIGDAMPGERKYLSPVLAKNGNICAMPCDADRVLEVNPATGAVRKIGDAILGEWKYSGPVRAENGNIYVMPFSADHVSVFVPPRKCSCESDALQGFSAALQSGAFSDLEVAARDGSVRKAHKMVLASMSPVFASMFAAPMQEQHAAHIGLEITSESVLEIFLSLLYTGNFGNAREPLVPDTLELLQAAHHYQVSGIASVCQAHLINNFAVNNIVGILVVGHHLVVEDLKQKALDFMMRNLDDVRDTDTWETLPADLVREVVAAQRGQRLKRRRSAEYEFPEGAAWNSLSKPQLRRALAERGLGYDGSREALLQRLQA